MLEMWVVEVLFWLDGRWGNHLRLSVFSKVMYKCWIFKGDF